MIITSLYNSQTQALILSFKVVVPFCELVQYIRLISFEFCHNTNEVIVLSLITP